MSVPLILLAGGVSSRMKRPLTAPLNISENLLQEANTLPKCMLSVGPKSERFLEFILKNAQEAGFLDVILVLGEKDEITAKYVNEVLLNRGIAVTVHIARQYIPQEREKPWGTGDALYQALDQFQNLTQERFVLANSDNLLPVSVYKSGLNAVENTLICFSTESFGIPNEKRTAYGLVAIDPETRKVGMIVEKPDLETLSKLDEKYSLSINVNCISADGPESLAFLKNLAPHPIRNEKEVTDLFDYFAKKNALYGEISHEKIPDLTSKEDIPSVQDFLKKNFK